MDVENETTSVSTQFASPASLTSRELPASQQLTAEAIAGPGLKKIIFQKFLTSYFVSHQKNIDYVNMIMNVIMFQGMKLLDWG